MLLASVFTSMLRSYIKALPVVDLGTVSGVSLHPPLVWYGEFCSRGGPDIDPNLINP